jgi:hypothetical protein
LADEDAVERIPVVKRQSKQAVQVLRTDWEQLYAVRPQLNRDQLVERTGKGELAQAGLDRNLPRARNAEKARILWILDRRPCARTEPGVSCQKPEQRVRVQEQVHCS